MEGLNSSLVQSAGGAVVPAPPHFTLGPLVAAYI